MKYNFLRKAKWYIVGFILVAIMLSVSLSFCAWDTLSTKARLNGNGGWYTEKPTKYMLAYADDLNSNGKADVGEIVTFGKYYQELTPTGEIAPKTSIRWRVVHEENNQLSLLTDNVMAFGCFWGAWYIMPDGSETWGGGASNGAQYQNYSVSTVRAWLNSDYTLRSDMGTALSANAETVTFRGFMSEAFSADEQSYIVPKTISGIKGYGKDNNPNTPTESYATVTDKVWIPSWSEVYGTTETHWKDENG